ncbi:AMIN domain-containing protein [Pseudodesulfovibrio sp. JC047]|uniref:AMIN domain-containing protein n=1 Tax=Pseudodesulfovibrio sp. JC047 TaxID=2683199 RepID=UPI0013D3FAE8|nr:AMIN domain-containing protein [Pseudodesulfovibrio sp. JC047]NDV20124.1 AMIN domain-containing protein [Pseudodesulfovibrio sp. JC047]
MLIRFGKWFFPPVLCLTTLCVASLLTAQMSIAAPPVRNKVRMEVDFTVLPMVLPDGSEATIPPVESDIDAVEIIPESEAILLPENVTTPPSIPSPTAASAPKKPLAKPEPEPKQTPPLSQTPAPQITQKRPSQAQTDTSRRIHGITVSKTDTGFILTVQSNRPVTDTRYFNLTDPRRLVFDLIGPWKYDKTNVIRLSGPVKHVVIGEHPDKLRMVVHFSTPLQHPLTPTVTSTKNTLTATVVMP